MSYIRLNNKKSSENYKKCSTFDEKIAKSLTSFRKNKPNSPIVQTGLKSFTTMNYTIFTSLTKVKNKPNQTQYKANSNPFAKRPKMNIRSAITKDYENISRWLGTKTNPIQTQNKFILECRSRGPNFKRLTCPALCISIAVSHLLIDMILPLYKLGSVRYYSLRNCRCSSMEEHSFRKAEVEGSTPSIGFVNLKSVICLKPSE